MYAIHRHEEKDMDERAKVSVNRVVSNQHVARTAGYDLILALEEECLKVLVEQVHEDGRKGEDWPKVERTPMRWTGGRFALGELEPCRPSEAMEWRITAEVWTVPR